MAGTRPAMTGEDRSGRQIILPPLLILMPKGLGPATHVFASSEKIRERPHQPSLARSCHMLAAFRDRIVAITFTPRAGKYHLISVRDASRTERAFYHARHTAL
jgi:uncharacterized DUF497 family protein